jgi:hypothetical protein
MRKVAPTKPFVSAAIRNVFALEELFEVTESSFVARSAADLTAVTAEAVSTTVELPTAPVVESM